MKRTGVESNSNQEGLGAPGVTELRKERGTEMRKPSKDFVAAREDGGNSVEGKELAPQVKTKDILRLGDTGKGSDSKWAAQIL